MDRALIALLCLVPAIAWAKDPANHADRNVDLLRQYYEFGKGAKPTHRHFEVLVTHWWRFDDSGRIVWHEVTRDDLGMYRQLGLLPDALPTDKQVSPVK